MAIIQAHSLVKKYGDFTAVDGIDFTVKKGTCTGLLGPNGAGKTTTMRMIMGLTSQTGGTLTLFGEDAATISKNLKRKVGLVSQEDNLDPDLSVLQNLQVYGRYFGLDSAYVNDRIEKLLAFMQLTDKTHARVNQLSGGMKRRLVIARALINDPEFIILDEPTTGLDPQARVLIWKSLLELKAQGKTLLLTTHYMDEAQRLCDTITIIDGGQILDTATPADLIKQHVKGHVFEVAKPISDTTLGGLKALDNEDIGDAVLYYTDNPDKALSHMGDDTIFYHRPANLEDVFLKLTGRKLREGA